MKKHESHKILLFDDEESLKNKEFTFDLTLKDFNEKCIKINDLKEKVEQEINKINSSYDIICNKLKKSFELKHEKLVVEENNLKEKLDNEVTKVKEKLENFLSESSNLIRMCDRINKGVKKLENNNENNMIKTLSYISKINKIQKEINILDNQLLRNVNLDFKEEKSDIIFDEYFFNGCPVPNNIKITNITDSSFKVSWKIDINNKNDDINKYKFKIELKNEKDNNFVQVYEGSQSYFKIEGLSQNSNYEIRICTIINDFNGPWGEIQKIKTKNTPNVPTLKDLFGSSK